MPTPDVEKAAFRTVARKNRIQLSSQRNELASKLACEHVINSQWWAGAKSIALYAAYGSEINPIELETYALDAGKRTFYPRVEGDSLVFAEGRFKDLQPGFAGILEPNGLQVDLESLELIVVPGLAFDQTGQRLGSGRGFYDRTLEKDSKSLGFAYAEQIVDKIPTGPHDRRMRGLVSDEGFVLYPNFVSAEQLSASETT